MKAATRISNRWNPYTTSICKKMAVAGVILGKLRATVLPEVFNEYITPQDAEKIVIKQCKAQLGAGRLPTEFIKTYYDIHLDRQYSRQKQKYQGLIPDSKTTTQKWYKLIGDTATIKQVYYALKQENWYSQQQKDIAKCTLCNGKARHDTPMPTHEDHHGQSRTIPHRMVGKE